MHSVLILALLMFAGPDRAIVGRVLDDFHKAASDAGGFCCFFNLLYSGSHIPNPISFAR